MNETTNPAALVIAETRKRNGLTYRAFAEKITEHLVNLTISHQTIMNWEKGCTEPPTDFLLTCLVVHADWRRQFAIDCLVAKLPEVFERVDGSIQILI
jgi:transcriptional regulator with XRE-family HTH domain